MKGTVMEAQSGPAEDTEYLKLKKTGLFAAGLSGKDYPSRISCPFTAMSVS